METLVGQHRAKFTIVWKGNYNLNWKPIKNWETLYSISDTGEVRGERTGKIIKGDINNAGYRRVTFYNGNTKERKFIHKLVLETFAPKDNQDLVVNHIDGDKLNNNLKNLEWVTRSENNIHALKMGLCGEWKGEFIVTYLDGATEIFDNQRQFAKQIGVSSTLVRLWLDKKLDINTDKYKIKNINYCNKCLTTIENTINRERR